MARRKVSAADKRQPDNDAAEEITTSELTTEMLGSEVPKNNDGSLRLEGEIDLSQAKRIGALDPESAARNQRAKSNIKKARMGQPVRWNETDARLLFDNVRAGWPTGVKIYIQRVEPDPEDCRPIDMSSLPSATAFYDHMLRYVHKVRGPAKYKCVFRDIQDRGAGFLNMPDTTGEDTRSPMGGGGNGQGGPFPGGMPYPPPMYYGQPPGYPPNPYGQQPPPGYYPPPGYGYPPPYGHQPPPQAPAAPPPAAPPAPVAPVAAPPATAAAPEQPYAQPPPQAPQAPQVNPYAQPPPWYQPPQPQPPPAPPVRDTAVEQQMGTMFWQNHQLQEQIRQNQLQLERALGAISVRDQQIEAILRGQAAPPAPAPVAAPAAAPPPPPYPPPYAPAGGFANMGPNGAPPPVPGQYGVGVGAPPPAYPQQPHDPNMYLGAQAYPYPPQPGYPPQGYAQPPQYPPPQPAAPQYPQPPAAAAPTPTGNPALDLQRQISGAMQTVGSLARSMEDLKAMINGGESAEEDPLIPPPVATNQPTPFQTMPLGGGPDPIQYAFNEHDGSPHVLGTILANLPKLGNWANTIGRAVAKAAAAEAEHGQAQRTIDVQPEMQQAPSAPMAPAHTPTRGFPVAAMR